MKSEFEYPIRPTVSSSRKILVAVLAGGFFAVQCTATTIVYQASDSTNNFVPDDEDGTPNRPVGRRMGNTITLDGTARYLTGLTIRVATTDALAPDQTVSVTIFANDGGSDSGGSGFQQPDTVIASASVSGVSLASGLQPVAFSFPSVQVPDTFTFIVDFSPGTAASRLVGMMSNNSPAQVGSGVDTLWYGTGAAGAWLTDANWAKADGAANNLIDAVFTADSVPVNPVPESAPLFLAMIGAAVGSAGWRKLFRR